MILFSLEESFRLLHHTTKTFQIDGRSGCIIKTLSSQRSQFQIQSSGKSFLWTSSILECIERNNFKPSANKRCSEYLKAVTRSLINKMKSKGPRLEPCGTPEVSENLDETALLK
ncbi:hypothetical protein HNY73_008792 [Argiope bruennichi]|uniref:Uncharacterized protein n=1 Tax=Argiope bruennichi TaxID=94029 RepID=A0A8T0FA63_ARGBR|nr:hypothetical protein HNY73_008792 [Argiope bruennichi]